MTSVSLPTGPDGKGNSRPYGFIEFEDEESCNYALRLLEGEVSEGPPSGREPSSAIHPSIHPSIHPHPSATSAGFHPASVPPLCVLHAGHPLQPKGFGGCQHPGPCEHWWHSW